MNCNYLITILMKFILHFGLLYSRCVQIITVNQLILFSQILISKNINLKCRRSIEIETETNA